MSSIVVRNPSETEIEKAAEAASKAFTNSSPEHWQRSFRRIAEMFGRRCESAAFRGGRSGDGAAVPKERLRRCADGRVREDAQRRGNLPVVAVAFFV